MKAESSLCGVMVVDKPAGWTSHDVVGKMRGIAGTRRVGHLGTLDPLATGVLPVMIGQATRLARYWENSEKTYDAVIRFGFATDTFDREGEPAAAAVAVEFTMERLESELEAFRGEILQKPPPVSAKKIHGVPAYKLARQKIAVELAPVRITIHELKLRSFEGERARITVRCSKGTYIRSLAHDLGRAIGCGAHIDELVRTAAGPFRLEHAASLERLQQLKDEDRLEEVLLAPADLLPEMPAVEVDEITLLHIRQGRNFRASPFRVKAGTPHVKAIAPNGSVAAVGSIVLPDLYHPDVVLA